MRRLATGLLVVMVLLLVAAQHFEGTNPSLGFVRAFAEAAVVGALADWFAVTALFRHPLGVPIPHTAIVPRNKDRIGDNLGRFVQENFLSPPLVAERIAHVDFAGRFAKWLSEPAQAAWLAAGITGVLPRILHSLDDQDLRRFAKEQVTAGLRQIEIAPVAGEVLALLTRDNRHQELVTQLIERIMVLVQEYKPQLREKVRKEVWWGLRTWAVDELVYAKIVAAVDAFLEELRNTPTHELRSRFDQALERLIEELKSSPAYRAQGEAFKRQLLENPALQEYIASVWREIRNRIVDDVARPDSAIRAQLQASIMKLGQALLHDQAMRDKLNAWIRAEIVAQLGAHGHQIALLISETIRKWDAKTVTDKVESEVGSDLQYIRINGTIIGGLVGLLIYAVSLLV